MGRLFVTGASGFVGRHLVRQLLEAGNEVSALSRNPEEVGALGSADGAGTESLLRVLRGDLLEPSTYREELEGCEVVVHLAATTGKASRKEHFRGNFETTERLVEACRECGVAKLLFVSSIAVKFPDKRRYHYAQAKAAAEQVVAQSGLNYTNLRPTMVFGKGSPVFAGLAKLASAPVVPIFGRGDVRVQPIDVGDLARAIATLLRVGSFQGETIELGGPEVATIEALLRKIRELAGHPSARVVHVPIGPLLFAVGAMEKLAAPLMPITSGQLASFRFDGTAEASSVPECLAGRCQVTKDLGSQVRASL